MKNYRKVFDFYYKGNSYNMYLDENNKHFFTKNNTDGSISYVTIEELLDLSLLFTEVPLVMNAKRGNKTKIIPKVIIGGVAVVLSYVAITTAIEMYKSERRLDAFYESRNSISESVEQDLKNYISYTDPSTINQSENVEDDNNELVVDTYLDSDWLGYLYIYDMQYLDKAFNYENVSIDQVKSLIKDNSKISDKFKDLLYEYCDALINRYPDIELRVLYENLKTLEVVECDKKDLVAHSLSMDSYGCYVRTENKIYVLKDYDYVKGTWPYQVIFHEFSHCLRNGNWNIDGIRVKAQVEGLNFSNTITAEALNSLFAVSLFDYNEPDVAYQLQSNYNGIMIECMDNYKMEDYVKHSVSYYASKLDEFNNDDNYATVILELMQAQYDDYHDDRIYATQDQYYPIYDYIANMYYKKYITADMTYSEAVSVTDQLINRIMYDVPAEYNIDIEHFYDYLKEYCNSLGIENDMPLRN